VLKKGFTSRRKKILKQECEKLNSPQYEACLRKLDDQSYDDYRRETEKIMEEEILDKKLSSY